MYFVYILECADNTLYTGITTDLAKRMEKHAAGTGAAYTRARKPKKIVYSEQASDRSSALRREAEIKRWARAKKLDLIRAHRRR